MAKRKSITKQRVNHEPAFKKRKLSKSEQEINESEEDEDGYLLTSELDYDMQSAVQALRHDDPSVYDPKHSFVGHTTQIDDTNTDSYPWVKQLDDKQDDSFLQTFFAQQLWKCKDENVLSSMETHRGYKGREHNLDDTALSEDDRDVDKQNDFEREWQKKQSLEFEKEINQQMDKQKHACAALNNHQNHKTIGNTTQKNNALDDLDAKQIIMTDDEAKLLDFLEESD
eukprot:22642_1